jgi:hypothetical protein
MRKIQLYRDGVLSENFPHAVPKCSGALHCNDLGVQTQAHRRNNLLYGSGEKVT